MAREYIAFWRGKKIEVTADSSYEAQQKAQKKLGAKKGYEITVMLADIEHKPFGGVFG